ncbi:nucleotide disphospho-sugar-binding domain-containing protein [Nonomuraea glycinis]|uniref:nucleotide disphospho-sugar-binding domain-containing protein n=1 Tax=Nonomuraea glycinis TaxID=2047744 RepID=UPI0033B93F0C
MVPVGWALRAAGHEVRVAVPPACVNTVADSGLPALSAGQDVEVVRGTPGRQESNGHAPRARVLNALDTFVRVADSMADDLVGYARTWRPDLILHDPLAFAGPLAAGVLDVPSVRHLWGVDMTTNGTESQASLLAELGSFGSLLSRFGLREVADLGTLTLSPCPPSMQVPARSERQPVQYVPYNGPGVQPRWAASLPRVPRVCVTWGRTVARFAGRISFPAQAVVEAALAEGAEVLVATTSEQLPELPPDVRVAMSVPLHMLLPACSAIVHQGGGGTVLTSLRAGIPQLVLGRLPDHAFHADRVARAGVGLRLDPGEADVPRLRAELSRLLSEPAYTEAAQRMREEMLAQPTPADVVGVLERLGR